MKPRSHVGRSFKLAGIVLAIGLTAASCSKDKAADTTAAAAETEAVKAAETDAPAAAETTAAAAAAETTAAAAAAPAGEGGEITVAIVDNPTMKDIQTLTPDNFTKTTGIKVNYVSLDEQTLREQVTKSVGSGAAPA